MAAMVGIAIAYIDSGPTWDDTSVTAFALVIIGTACGFAAPRRPWRWALASGIWISIFAIFRSSSPGALVMLIVVVFPLAGAYAGAATRRALLKSLPPADGHHVFHDKAGVFEFLVSQKAGMGQSRTGGRCSDRILGSFPFWRAWLLRCRLGPLGSAHSVTRLEHTASPEVSTFEVVFGDQKRVLRIEIGRDGRSVSVHWSRPGN